MVDEHGADAERVPDEVGAVVAGVAVPLEGVFEGVEGRGGEAALVDVGERAAQAAVGDAEEVVVCRRRFEFGDEREGVEAAAVVVDLSLDALELPTVDVVPDEEDELRGCLKTCEMMLTSSALRCRCNPNEGPLAGRPR